MTAEFNISPTKEQAGKVLVPAEVLRELDVAVAWKWVRIADNDDQQSWVKVPVLRERDGRQGWIETPAPNGVEP